MPKLPSLLILSHHAFSGAFTAHAAADSALLGFVLRALSGQRIPPRNSGIVATDLPKKSHKKGTKLSGVTWKAPRRPHLQFKGKLANQTLCHCQRKLMLKN